MQFVKDMGNVVGNGVYWMLGWKLSTTEKVYTEAVQKYKVNTLDMLFPNRGLDKKLEAYIINFVDRKSLKSMILVSKSWFLRAYLLKYVDVRSVGDIKLRSQLANGLFLSCGISIKIADENQLDGTINFLKKNEKLYEYVKWLDLRSFSIDYKNYKKFEALFNKLPNLLGVRFGEVCAMTHDINLCHDKLEFFETLYFGSQKAIILKMKNLKTLSIFTMWGMILGQKVEFVLPSLKECSISSLDWFKEVTFNFDEVRKCEIDVIGNSDITIIAPKVENFNVKKVMSGGVMKLKNFPKEVINQWKSKGYCAEDGMLVFSDSTWK